MDEHGSWSGDSIGLPAKARCASQCAPTFLVRFHRRHERRIRNQAAAVGKRFVGTRLSFDAPPGAKQGGQYTLRFNGRPLAHAAMDIVIGTARLSPCSKRSATTRNASTSTLAIASSRVAP